MKRLFACLLLMLSLAASACAWSHEALPAEVLTLCKETYPGYEVCSTGGQYLDIGNAFAVIMTKDGDNVLLIIEQDADGSYAVTLNNPDAIWDETDGLYDPASQNLAITIERSAGGCAKLYIGRYDKYCHWVFSCERGLDGKWDTVLSECVDMSLQDINILYWTHIFDGQYYAAQVFIEDKDGKTLASCGYPNVPVSGETLRCAALETFDVSLYPPMHASIERMNLSDYAANLLPANHKLLQIVVQPTALILLTESTITPGARHLRLHPYRNNQLGVATLTKTLPAESSIDLYHGTNDSFVLSLGDGYRYASFRQTQDDRWTLMWYTSQYGSFNAGYNFISDGLNPHADPFIYGQHPFSDIAQLDFDALPRLYPEAVSYVDQSHYAVVNNPDPADRLHMRKQPDRSADSLGKFYNGTPVLVHEVRDGWARVSIGLDGMMAQKLEGWMMTKYLAFGDEMNKVSCAFPQEIVRDPYSLGLLFLLGGDYRIIGIKDEYYILINDAGAIRFQRSDSFWSGNG